MFVGMNILYLSKHLMYHFYYNQLQRQYGDRRQLLYTDTDSFLLEIQTKDVNEDMAKSAGLYDTSDYPENHPLHSTANKKVRRKMKEECVGRPIAEYIGWRLEMYSILEASGRNIKKSTAWKRTSWKRASGRRNTERLSSVRRPSTTAWMSSGQRNTTSMGSTWTRSRCPP